LHARTGDAQATHGHTFTAMSLPSLMMMLPSSTSSSAAMNASPLLPRASIESASASRLRAVGVGPIVRDGLLLTLLC
jgi:hypothetical protein